MKRERTGSRVPYHLFAVVFAVLSLTSARSWAYPQAPGDDAASQKLKNVDDVKHDTPGVAIKPNRMIRTNVSLALVNVTVTDPYNRLVTGLEPDNFRVFEDNVEQEIESFSSEDVPISIGVVFDVSGSMGNKIGKAREAAVQSFKTANTADEFFLVSFNERAELTSEFTNSVEDLQSRMALTATKGRTALLDAIYLGLSQMRGARNAKRALLIISDGGDNHSRYNENDIKRLVKEADTQLYAIGIFDPLGYRSRTPEELNGPSLLTDVTDMTGGRVFSVERIEDLPDIATKIGMELRNQYVLGYRPSNKAHDARWRKVTLCLRKNRILRAESLIRPAVSLPPQLLPAFLSSRLAFSPLTHRRPDRIHLLPKTANPLPQGNNNPARSLRRTSISWSCTRRWWTTAGVLWTA